MTLPMLSHAATACFFFFVALHPLRAELKWDAHKIDLKPLPTDAVAEAKFGFVNAGKSEATIESVNSSCGCTVPALVKSTGKPDLAFLSIEVDSGGGPAIQRAYVQIASPAK